ncbi:MAG: tetratricopeptide repeat protein [Fuerstiella sp.]
MNSTKDFSLKTSSGVARQAFQFVLLAIGVCLPLSQVAVGQDAATQNKPEANKPQKFIVRTAGAELRTPDKIVWKAYLGETYTVDQQKDEWLWVQEKGGWIWIQNTLPFDSAIEITTQEIDKEGSAENYHLRGVAYLAHGKPDKAIEDFNESLKKKSGIAGVLNNRGTAWYEKEDYTKAKADFSAAVKSSKTHFVAYNNRALCSIAEENYPSAMADLNAAIGMNKDYPEALNNRGVVHSRQGDYSKAIKDFSEAIKIYDRYQDALGNRSYAYRQSGKFDKAITDLELAIKYDPLAHQPVNDLAWIYATAKSKRFRNGKKAVSLATKACEMTQYRDWNTLDTLAAAFAASGDFDNALQWVSTAMENAPEDRKAALKEHQEQFQSKKALEK